MTAVAFKTRLFFGPSASSPSTGGFGWTNTFFVSADAGDFTAAFVLAEAALDGILVLTNQAWKCQCCELAQDGAPYNVNRKIYGVLDKVGAGVGSLLPVNMAALYTYRSAVPSNGYYRLFLHGIDSRYIDGDRLDTTGTAYDTLNTVLKANLSFYRHSATPGGRYPAVTPPVTNDDGQWVGYTTHRVGRPFDSSLLRV